MPLLIEDRSWPWLGQDLKALWTYPKVWALLDVLPHATNGCGEETLCRPTAVLQALGFTPQLIRVHVRDGQREWFVDRWGKIIGKEVRGDISLFPTLLVIYYFPFECLLDLTPVMQEATQSGEWSQVMYCLTQPSFSFPPSCFMFAGCLIYVKLS